MIAHKSVCATAVFVCVCVRAHHSSIPTCHRERIVCLAVLTHDGIAQRRPPEWDENHGMTCFRHSQSHSPGEANFVEKASKQPARTGTVVPKHGQPPYTPVTRQPWHPRDFVEIVRSSRNAANCRKLGVQRATQKASCSAGRSRDTEMLTCRVSSAAKALALQAWVQVVLPERSKMKVGGLEQTPYKKTVLES